MLRLDNALVDRGICVSREKAQRVILAGQVRVNGQLAHKPSERVKPGDELLLANLEKYVSRGGFKLEHALQFFRLDVTGCRALDVGASTGGFTDCLLQHGAIQVIAIDVGHGQLAWKLRHHPKVLVMERTNARYLLRSDFPETFAPPELAVIDCSFISLRRILPAAVALLAPGAKIVALIKPQFEAGREEANRGQGVIKNPEIHRRVLTELREFVESETDLEWRADTESPITGPAGNKEFLVLLEKNAE